MVRKSHRFQNVRRVHGSAGAGGTGGAVDAPLVEEHECAFAFDTFKRDVRRIRQSILTFAIHLGARYRFKDRVFKAIPQCGDLDRVVSEMSSGNFCRLPQCHDR